MNFAGKKSIPELMLLRYFVPVRRNCDGSCCECGACCDRVLMLTKKEKKGIKHYLMSHPEIKAKIQNIYKDVPHRKCPFLDITQAEHKCMIYNSVDFPIICRTYNCDHSKMDPQKILPLYRGERPQHVDMWAYFLNDPVDITKAWAYKDFLENHIGRSVPPQVMLEPEKLNEFFNI